MSFFLQLFGATSNTRFFAEGALHAITLGASEYLYFGGARETLLSGLRTSSASNQVFFGLGVSLASVVAAWLLKDVQHASWQRRSRQLYLKFWETPLISFLGEKGCQALLLLLLSAFFSVPLVGSMLLLLFASAFPDELLFAAAFLGGQLRSAAYFRIADTLGAEKTIWSALPSPDSGLLGHPRYDNFLQGGLLIFLAALLCWIHFCQTSEDDSDSSTSGKSDLTYRIASLLNKED